MAFNLRYIHSVTDIIITILGIFVDLFLIFIILKTKSVEIKKYSRITLQSIIVDIFLGILTFVTRPMVITFRSSESLIPSPIFRTTPEIGILMIYFWIGALFFAIYTVPISFYYRYRIICQKQSFSFARQIILLFIAGILSTTMAIHSYYAYRIRTKAATGVWIYVTNELTEQFGDPENGNNDDHVNIAGLVGTVRILWI
uniref:Uncharacterized protein n=1 Tax=Panagrolaimus sp. JU765 TaxID=591449 RepID=A0AC34RMD1_9BILA